MLSIRRRKIHRRSLLAVGASFAAMLSFPRHSDASEAEPPARPPANARRSPDRNEGTSGNQMPEIANLKAVSANRQVASIRYLKTSSAERQRHQNRAATLKRKLKNAGLPVLDNPSHIVPVLVGNPVHCKQVTDELLARVDIYVQPINYPTVPRGTERLRLTPTPQHSDADMDKLAVALTALFAECPMSEGLKRAAE